MAMSTGVAMKMTISEAARYLGKSQRQMRYMLKLGQLKGNKVDGRWVFEQAELPVSPERVRVRTLVHRAFLCVPARQRESPRGPALPPSRPALPLRPSARRAPVLLLDRPHRSAATPVPPPARAEASGATRPRHRGRGAALPPSRSGPLARLGFTGAGRPRGCRSATSRASSGATST